MAVTAHEWQATAAYLYVLHLDSGSLAWEYLRRNSKYVRDWQRGARHRARAAIGWGLRFPCRPLLDARIAHPIWLENSGPLVRLDRVDDAPLRFSFWKLPGRKTLWHDGQRLILDILLETCAVRLAIAGSLDDGAPFGYAMPAGFEPPRYRSLFESAVAIVQAPSISNSVSRPRPPRAALIHMRTLQVLDALNAGASQREIAVVLFGAASVARQWEPDSELRAQVRYLIRRGREHVRSGYRQLTRA